jgi:acetolactate synthase-1/3 small subunit
VRDDKKLSRMWLLVNEEERLSQLIKQTEKLVDVLSVEQHPMEGSAFEATQEYFV